MINKDSRPVSVTSSSGTTERSSPRSWSSSRRTSSHGQRRSREPQHRGDVRAGLLLPSVRRLAARALRRHPRPQERHAADDHADGPGIAGDRHPPDVRAGRLAGPILLLLARIAQGMSLGGEVSNASAYLAEIAPPERRGRYSSFFYISTGTSVLLASLLGVLLANLLTDDQLTDSSGPDPRTGARSAWRSAASGFICAAACPAVTSAAEIPRRTSTLRPTSTQLRIR